MLTVPFGSQNKYWTTDKSKYGVSADFSETSQQKLFDLHFHDHGQQTVQISCIYRMLIIEGIFL